MKKATILFLMVIIIPIFAVAQSIENVDFISPFHDAVAAIKKDGKWAFINEEGKLIIDFRADLVTTKTEDGNYPIFNSDRCKIVDVKAGISYYGYIDKTGKTVIEPQFLNATNFNNKVATVLKLIKENVGRNEILGKNVVYYKYYEAIIDTNGTVIVYLNPEGVNVVLDKKFTRKPLHFKSRQLSKHLYAFLNENKRWRIIKINE